MKVLVLNCGSSSVKFQLIETDGRPAGERTLAKGLVENIGGAALVRYEAAGRKPLKETAEILEHKIAVERCLLLLSHGEQAVLSARSEIDAVGHRVVHGGERFRDSALIDEAVLEGIEDCFELAPLHNPPNVKGWPGHTHWITGHTLIVRQQLLRRMLSGGPHSASTLSMLSPSVTSRDPQRNESAEAVAAHPRAAARARAAATFGFMAGSCVAGDEWRLKVRSGC